METGLKLTDQQNAFVDEVITGKGAVALVARAGTGKTSTIIESAIAYAKVFPEHETLICAFAKPVQVEIDAKLKELGVDWRKLQAATTHSMGFGLVRFKFKGVQIDNDGKVRDLIRAQNGLVYDQYFSVIKQLVHLGKVEGFGFFDDVQIGDTHAWYRMADHYSINGFEDTTTDMDRVIEATQHIYRLSLEQTNVIDYDDMVLFPLVYNMTTKFRKHIIWLDEAQDTSRARRALVKLFLRLDGRLIAVGDDCQAIMGFAGASADALEQLIAETNAKVMPLNLTWRCPRKIVELAQQYVPDIVAAEGAIEGVITNVTELPAELRPTDSILCRNTAPLVETAYALIRRGVACRVEGREIGNGLLTMVNRWKVSTISAFLNKLEDWRDREVQKAMAKGKESKINEVNDKADTLVVICTACTSKKQTSLDDVRTFINDLFQDDVSGVLTLCTYHRSKGREWPRVMLLEHATRCPSKWARQAWEVKQEKHLAYVAITRVREELVFVN